MMPVAERAAEPPAVSPARAGVRANASAGKRRQEESLHFMVALKQERAGASAPSLEACDKTRHTGNRFVAAAEKRRVDGDLRAPSGTAAAPGRNGRCGRG